MGTQTDTPRSSGNRRAVKKDETMSAAKPIPEKKPDFENAAPETLARALLAPIGPRPYGISKSPDRTSASNGRRCG